MATTARTVSPAQDRRATPPLGETTAESRTARGIVPFALLLLALVVLAVLAVVATPAIGLPG